MLPFLVAVLSVLIRIVILPTIQDLIYQIILVGIYVSISIFDVDDGVSLDFP